jgi:subtilisin family serine protease
MKKIIIFILMMVLSVGIVMAQEKIFFYEYAKPVFVEPSKDTYFVKINPNIKISTEKEFVQYFGLNIQEKDVKKAVDGKYFYITNLKETDISITQSLVENVEISSVYPLYYAENGDEYAMINEIVFRALPEVWEEKIEELNKIYGCKTIKKTKLFQVVEIPKDINVFDIANQYFEEGLFKYAMPNFHAEKRLLNYYPNDEYFNMQITCHNTGQIFTDGHTGTADADIDAPEAWDITKGDNSIVIAVLDQGVTSNHPDLPNTRQVRLNGSNFGVGDPNDPSPIWNENHGNSCAGVIAATMDNNEGIAGVAPNCKIMPIRMLDAGNTGTAASITFAVTNGADILSCSWGWGTSNPNYVPVVKDAIEDAIDNGAVVAFAASNSANCAVNNDGYVGFPANVFKNYVLTVGATDRYDQKACYSPVSDPSSPNNQIIDITATSHRAYPTQIAGEDFEMWTIDIPGNNGYNPADPLPTSGTNYLSYTGRFGGTSHACPIVAGVAALILSIDNTLTPQQVFEILTETANDVGGYTYTNSWSEELGHGRVNAFNAVMTACPGNYTIDWDIENSQIIEYQAGNYIQAEALVESGTEVEVHAGNYVRHTAGFTAEAGSNYHSYIAGCGTMTRARKPDESILNEIDPKVSFSRIRVYPNPNNGSFSIKGLLTGAKVYIYDIMGEEVKSFKATQNMHHINLSTPAKGMYYIKIIYEEFVFFDKIIVI